MKKILTVLMVLIAAVCTAFAFGACDLNELFGTSGDNSDGGSFILGDDESGSGSSSNNNGSSANNGNTSSNGSNSSANNSSSGNNSSANNSSTNNSSSSSSNSSTNNGSATHTCVFVFTKKVDGCVTNGYDLFTCKEPDCGKTEKHGSYAPVGHDYEHKTFAATCTSNYAEADVCTRCGDEKGKTTTPGTKTAHAYNWSETNAATCTATGLKTGVCADCGATDTEVIPANGHSYGNYVADNNATCTADGTESRVCANCQDVDSRTIADSKTGHSYGNYTADNNATCIKDGTESRVCATCKNVDSRTIANSKSGHKYGDYIADNNATCTSPATKTSTCSLCGDKRVQWILDSTLPHNFVNNKCTGCGVYISTDCGLIFTDYGDHCAVTGLGTANGNVVIPSTFNGKPVTDIGFVFNGKIDDEGNRVITGLVIPDSVSDLPADACYGNTGLESVVLGDGITVLSDSVFGNCTNLLDVTLGKYVTRIEEAFYGCSTMTRIRIPKTLTFIEAYAFRGCNNLQAIMFEGTVAEWNAITKENNWLDVDGSHSCYVYCSGDNGSIKLV